MSSSPASPGSNHRLASVLSMWVTPGTTLPIAQLFLHLWDEQPHRVCREGEHIANHVGAFQSVCPDVQLQTQSLNPARDVSAKLSKVSVFVLCKHLNHPL